MRDLVQWPHIGPKFPEQCYEMALSRHWGDLRWKAQQCTAVGQGGWETGVQLQPCYWPPTQPLIRNTILCSASLASFSPSCIYLGLIIFVGKCFVEAQSMCVWVFNAASPQYICSSALVQKDGNSTSEAAQQIWTTLSPLSSLVMFFPNYFCLW